LVDAPDTPRERVPGTACLSIRPLLLEVLQLIVFHRFSEVGGTSACHFCLITSVETSSPP
jgi:hypothetical protein